MDSVTAAEIAKLDTMTVSKLVEKFESLVDEKCRSRNKRYRVILFFIWLPSPELAIQRVAKRVR